MSNDFVLIQFFCIISVNLIDLPRPVNTVHPCSRTYFEDQYLLIILVDSDIANNDKVDNLFHRMTGHPDSKLYACFSSEASHSNPLQRFAVPSRCNITDGCLETDRSIIGFTCVDGTSGEAAHSEFKVHCLRPNSSSILSVSGICVSQRLTYTWILGS